MTRWDFKLPDIGEGVTEGEVVQWLVKAGEVVKEDQPMVEVMTDKATVTITSPKAGTIVELKGKPGEIVKVHSVLVVYELNNNGGATPHPGVGTASASSSSTSAAAAPSPSIAAEPTAKSTPKGAGPAATAVGDIKEDLPGMSLLRSTSPATSPSGSSMTSAGGGALQNAYFSDKPLATPATRKLARDLGVDLKRVPPTGRNGRVTKDDVNAFTTTPRNGNAPVTQPSMTSVVRARAESGPMETRTPFVGIRRKIAERMSTSKNTAAHFTFVEECDCTALKATRERLKPHAEKEGVKLTFLAFIAKAVVASIRRHPTLNSTLDESTNELVVRRNVDLGIAAATDAGLVVPVIKDAHAMTILEIAREIERLGSAAKQGKLKPAELTGSTFTITSLGAQGGLFATPIINFPEVAILGVHQMKQKPVVRDGQIVIGDVMLLSLSFDHRIIDGHVGAAFAYEIIGYLQEPDRFLLES